MKDLSPMLQKRQLFGGSPRPSSWRERRTALSMVADRSRRGRPQSGSISLLALPLILLIGGLCALAVKTGMGFASSLNSDTQARRTEAILIAANDALAQEIWSAAERGNGVDFSVLEFRAFLSNGNDTLGPPLNSGETRSNDDVAAQGTALEQMVGVYGDAGLSGMRVERRDTLTTTQIHITSTSRDQRRRRAITQTVTVGSREFAGADYALLSRDIQCTMCHLSVDNAQRFYNTVEGRFGTFDRAKVGNLGDLELSSGSGNEVFGSLYVGGEVLDPFGGTDPMLYSEISGVELDGRGRIVEDEFGHPISTGLMHDAPGRWKGGLFTNYPRGSGGVDGDLPAEFPEVIPDIDGDGVVSASEIAQIGSTARGSIRATRLATVPAGQSYTGGLPVSGAQQSVSDSFTGGLVVYGTEDDPIEISGEVMVDGDVIIAGFVKGGGSIMTTGSILLLSGIQYADGVDATGRRTFGVAEDGTENLLTLVAGESVILGDPSAENEQRLGETSYWKQSLAQANRDEYTKASPLLPDGNGAWLDNPLYDPDYVPRYMTLSDQFGIPVAINGHNRFDFQALRWRDWWASSSEAHIEYLGPTSTGYAAPAYVVNDWVSAQGIADLNAEALQDSDGTSASIDALVYSNTSVWGIARDAQGRHLQINGSILAPVVALLATDGVQVNYDTRQRGRLRLELDGPAVMGRHTVRRSGVD